jgi:hypothetical protein
MGGQDTRLRQTQLIGLKPGLSRIQACCSGLLAGEVLGRLLAAIESGGNQLLGTLGIGLGLGQAGLGLGDGSTGLRRFGGDRVAGDARQQLALAHPVADIDQDFGQPTAADLGADRGLLPGDDIAIGRQQTRPVGDLGGHQPDAQGRPGAGRRRRRRVPGPGGRQGIPGAGRPEACKERQRPLQAGGTRSRQRHVCIRSIGQGTACRRSRTCRGAA